MHAYDADFYDFLNSFAERSASVVIPVVRRALTVRSVVDFGCGEGAWLRVWSRSGAEIFGLDGPYVQLPRLLIPSGAFRHADLAQPVNLGRRFDLVQSLEVAEHLRANAAAKFVAMLVQHSDHVLFSAAVPGQGGEHHVNERPLEYWRSLFSAEGYRAVDLVRPAILGDSNVQSWYRCNTILYVKEDRLGDLPLSAQALLVPTAERLAPYWPIINRARQSVLRAMPRRIVDALAHANAAMLARRARSH